MMLMQFMCWVIIISIGLRQDQNKAIELWKQAAKLGFSQAHFSLGNIFVEGVP
jgi:TPR repeat protein